LYLSSVGTFCKPANGVHILSGHFSGLDYQSGYDSFRRFIDNIASIAKLISFNEAISLIEKNNIQFDEPYVALTFDDGFYECYAHIAKILDEMSISACFFINAGVIEAPSEYLSSYSKRVEVRGRHFLTWDMLKEMSAGGHIIGSHTLDHFRLCDLDERAIELQIVENKSIIESKLGIQVTSFAWPYGKLSDISDMALNIAEKYHHHIFSGAQYKFYYSLNGRVFNRRHVESYWPKSHIKYFLSTKKSYDIN
jgi:peptidoglycan/xylan/chitin deacetylase (PgdA/CDA1 family)